MITLLLMIHSLGAAPASTVPTVPSGSRAHVRAVVDGHGKLAWFQGSFDDLVREATKTNKLIFLDFWIASDAWSKRLDAEAFADDAVAALMKDFVCYAVDGESKDGALLVKRYKVSGYPTLVFLEPDGSLRDRISGYMSPDQFTKEALRVKRGEGTAADARQRLAKNPDDVYARIDLALALRKLGDLAASKTELDAAKRAIAEGKGFDPKSLEDRWKLAQHLIRIGDGVAAQEQMTAIKSLDPVCKSLYCKRVKVKELTREVQQSFVKTKNVDATPMIKFLRAETEPEILFEGWCVVQNLELYQAGDAHKNQRVDEERFHRAAARDAGREAWKSCPPDQIADWGPRFAAFLYEDAAALSDEEKSLAVDIATHAAEAAPRSPDHLEVLACCLFAAGKREEAVQTLKRGLEIDPARKSLQKRLAEFQR